MSPIVVFNTKPSYNISIAGMVLSIIGLLKARGQIAGWIVILLEFIFPLIGVFNKPPERSIAGIAITAISISFYINSENIPYSGLEIIKGVTERA